MSPTNNSSPTVHIPSRWTTPIPLPKPVLKVKKTTLNTSHSTEVATIVDTTTNTTTRRKNQNPKKKKKRTKSLKTLRTKTAAGISYRIYNPSADATKPALTLNLPSLPQDLDSQLPLREQESYQSDAVHRRAEYQKCLIHPLGLRHSGREPVRAGTLLVRGGLNLSPTWIR